MLCEQSKASVFRPAKGRYKGNLKHSVSKLTWPHSQKSICQAVKSVVLLDMLRKSGNKSRLRLDVPYPEARLVSLTLSSRCTELLHKWCLLSVLDCIGSCCTEVEGPPGRVAADLALVHTLRSFRVAGSCDPVVSQTRVG